MNGIKRMAKLVSVMAILGLLATGCGTERDVYRSRFVVTGATALTGDEVPVRMETQRSQIGCSRDADTGESVTASPNNDEIAISPATGARYRDGVFVASRPGTYKLSLRIKARQEGPPMVIEVSAPDESGIVRNQDSGEPAAGAEQAAELIRIDSVMAVNAGDPPKPTVFTLDTAASIAEIGTYHWNDEQGAAPGSIALKSADGTTFGPWDVMKTTEGQGGVPNAYWYVYPNIELPAGTYTVIDSEPATWSWNDETGGMGIVWVLGTKR